MTSVVFQSVILISQFWSLLLSCIYIYIYIWNESENYRLDRLENKPFFFSPELLEEQNLNMFKLFVKNWLHWKMVLTVFNDVDDPEQLEQLVVISFGFESKIIAESIANKQVLV